MWWLGVVVRLDSVAWVSGSVGVPRDAWSSVGVPNTICFPFSDAYFRRSKHHLISSNFSTLCPLLFLFPLHH